MASIAPLPPRLPAPADKRLSYGSNDQQFGDLRVPAGSGPHPVVIYVHGGAWQSSVTLDGASHLCAALTAAGYATWSLEYRRIGNGGGWPVTFEDLMQGAAFVNELGQREQLDLGRVFVAGQSSGGHLAAWLATRMRHLEGPLTREGLPAIRGVVSLAGVLDLRRSAESSAIARQFLGGTPADVPDRYAAASPVELLPLGLPQLLVHGTADNNVPFEIGQRYFEAAKKAGDEIELLPIEGAGHFDVFDTRTEAWKQIKPAIEAFLKKHI
ncbi:MAG: alpha/beta hydrolase [Chloroflexota bacterium]|nr:alpha/beta hydrolase [Chloroflexota bacterium]